MNLGEFKSLLSRYLKRVDLTDLYNDWVAFTSSRIDQQLRLKEQEYRTITIPTSQFVALPDDFIEMRHLQSNYHGGQPLEYMTPAQLDRLRRVTDNQVPVKGYTITNNQLELAPSPAADNTDTELEMFYYAKLPTLLEDADTNKVLTAYPQLYLYGCMIEASAFRQADADANIYGQLWRDYAQELNTRQQAARYSGDSLQMRAG